MGSTPVQGTKIPHATEQLSLCATTTEVCAPQLESLCAAEKDPTRRNEDPTQPK